jgi:hypothetical protein
MDTYKLAHVRYDSFISIHVLSTVLRGVVYKCRARASKVLILISQKCPICLIDWKFKRFVINVSFVISNIILINLVIIIFSTDDNEWLKQRADPLYWLKKLYYQTQIWQVLNLCRVGRIKERNIEENTYLLCSVLLPSKNE